MTINYRIAERNAIIIVLFIKIETFVNKTDRFDRLDFGYKICPCAIPN